MSTAPFFDRQWASEQLPLPLHYRLLRRWEATRVDVAARLLPAGDVLLDVGCGSGELVRRVAERYRRLIASDVAAATLEDGQARTADPLLRDRIHWKVLDANQPLPFADGEISAVVSISTLQYLFDPEAFLAESFRVIAPGGQLLVEVPNMAYLPQRLRLLAGRPIRTSYWVHGIDGGNLHYFTVALLSGLIRRVGFDLRQVTGSGVFAALRTWWVSLLCGDVLILAQKPHAAL